MDLDEKIQTVCFSAVTDKTPPPPPSPPEDWLQKMLILVLKETFSNDICSMELIRFPIFRCLRFSGLKLHKNGWILIKDWTTGGMKAGEMDFKSLRLPSGPGSEAQTSTACAPSDIHPMLPRTLPHHHRDCELQAGRATREREAPALEEEGGGVQPQRGADRSRRWRLIWIKTPSSPLMEDTSDIFLLCNTAVKPDN